jgi:ZIP family zinc transporter
MANSFIASPEIGAMVALAIAVHNIPEEFAMAAPIAAVSRRRTLFLAAFLSGLAEPLGAAIGLLAVHIHPEWNALFMAFAAGAMIYVSLHELVPMARLYRQRALFTMGAAASVVVYLLMGRLITF